MSDPEAMSTATLAPLEADALPPQRNLIRFAIAGIILLFVVLVGILYYQSWYKAPETPVGLLVVNGKPWMDGVVIILDGRNGTIQQQLNAENEFRVTFHVPKGNYTLRGIINGRPLKFLHGGTATTQEQFRMSEHQYRQINLGPPPAETP